MGNTTYEVEQRRSKRLELHQKQQADADATAGKIIELINSVVIRPGPKPEERECTQVASELEALRPRIVKLILESD